MAVPNIEKTHQPSSRAVNSVRNLWTQMLGVKNSLDGICRPGLREACATQEKLSKFECKEEQIFSLALNTFKAAADVAVEKGGWEKLDELRREIYVISLPILQANKKVKRSLGNQVGRLRSENQDLKEKNKYLLRGRAILLSAYFDAIKTMRESQGHYPEMAEKLREHEVRFDVRKQIDEVEVNSDEWKKI